MRKVLLPHIVETVRRAGDRPRFHPNGFITLDLGEDYKMHVFPETPIRVRPRGERVHDHVFAFRSHVLFGEIGEYRYRAAKDARHPFRRYRVPCRDGRCHKAEQETELKPSKATYRLDLTERLHHRAGESYLMPPHVLHETFWSGFAVTLLDIYGGKGRAEVYLTDKTPFAFDRHPRGDEELDWAWAQIDRAVCAIKA